jgi:hypothetical protein
MINSPYIENKIRSGTTVAQIAKDTQTDEELVNQLFLRTFCRPPKPSESAKAISLLKTAANRKESAQDLLWALITAREFYFNH